ncbi:hypothetical protein ACEPPN_002985 [Leptodophora sp. 'Broadleaf-Isolate-01']
MDNAGFPIESCTLSTCSLLNGQVRYQPNLGGNIFYIAIFSLAIFLQVLFGSWYRTWGYLVGLFCGLVLEIVGYAARVQMHYNPFTKGPFVMYLVALTIGPTFFTASIYLCLARIIVVYGEGNARFKPRTYAIFFIASDIISLVLQATGGAKASGADTYDTKQSGIHIMVAGLALQVISLVIFTTLCADLIYSVRKSPRSKDPRFQSIKSSHTFKLFLYCLGSSTLLILIRSSFRVAELSEGFGSGLANNEVTFMVLEGGMIAAAVILLTALHPGLVFGSQGWKDAGWTISGKPLISVVSRHEEPEKATGRAH